MIDIFEKLDLTRLTCHSGGAEGSDTVFEKISSEFGVKVKAYSYKTPNHKSPNKVEISEEDYLEGVEKVKLANKKLNRWGIHKYMNLLARNWYQVKYSSQIFAIGQIIEPGGKCPKGYINKSKNQIVDGGTGYATQMGIDSLKDVNVYDQIKKKWFKWSYNTNSFIELKEDPIILCEDFAGIGTRKINQYGVEAIKNLFIKTFS